MDETSAKLNYLNLNGLVVFYLANELFCVDIDDVFAIVNPADFPQNIKNSFLVKSNLDIDNLTIPIIDLHAFFGLKNGKITETCRFICIERNKHTFAFVADKVHELITLDNNTKNKLQVTAGTENKYLTGTIKYGNDVLSLINFDIIINQLFVHH